jgi:4-hydroxybenzoate polyprenyltransferase
VDFDHAAGLFSLPRRLGVAGALAASITMHAVMMVLLALLAWLQQLGWPAFLGLAVVALLLAYEHSLVKPNDLSRVNAAFFTVNGWVSLLFFASWAAAVFLKR